MNGIVGKKVFWDDRHLHVELEDGRIISTPMSWYPELEKATQCQLHTWRLICDGTGLEWDALDYHLSIEAMLVAQPREHQAA